MSFNDIKGQDKAISFLKTSIANNRVSHAYIFLGPNSVGRKLAALNFAKALNCQSESRERPCDQCSSCKKIEAANHPDISLLRLEKPDASIKIDSIRELIRSVGLKSYEARKKVYIIDEAESMTQEASNALLKTLEEPPPDTILILIVESLNAMLPTIVSRSQVVKFFALGIDETKRILAKDHKIDDVMAHILAHLSAGRLGEAMKYKDEDLFEKRNKILNQIANKTFFDSDFDGLSRSDLKLCLDIMLSWYRDILIVSAEVDDSSMLVNIDRRDSVVLEAKILGLNRLDSIIKQIILTNSFLDENANPKLAMSVLGVNICTK